MRRVVNSIKELHKLLNVKKDFLKEEGQLNTYDLAHHVGFSLQEEYEFLNLLHERQRQEYLKRHLTKIIPMVAQMEGLKEKVKLNGHFKEIFMEDFYEADKLMKKLPPNPLVIDVGANAGFF